MIEVQLPDGRVVEFPDGTSQDVMRKALHSLTAPQEDLPPAQRNPDGTYGQPPEGMFANPLTGQTTSRDMLRANVDTSRGGAFLSGGAQGATYNFADEIVGGLSGAIYGPERGNFDRERTRAEYEANRAAHPIVSGASEIGGAVSTSIGGAGVAGKLGASVPTTLLGRAGAGAAIGAAEGALAGYGAGEGTGDRLSKAATFAALGGGIGFGAPLVAAGARSVGRQLAAPIDSLLRSKPNTVRAARAVQSALKRSGMDPAQVQDAIDAAAREGQPQFTMADAMGNSGQRMLAGVTRTPNDARQWVTETLTGRQNSQGERLSQFIADGLGATDTAAARRAALTTARDDAADIAYKAARDGASPVDVRGALSVIDDRIGGMQGSGIAGDGIDMTLSNYRGRLASQPGGAAFPGASSVEMSDFSRVLGIKQDLGDKIGEAVRAGRNNEARELMKLQREIDTALEAASPAYRQANDQFASASRVIDQIDAGKAASAPKVRSADVLPAYGQMTPEQQAAFRAGYADPVLARIEAAPVGVNKARPLTSGKAQAELPAMAKDGPLLQRQIARENTMFETGNAALGGSKTADNMADAAESASFNYGPLLNVLQGNWKTAASQLGPTITNAMQGRNSATQELLARQLMGRNVQGAIAPAIAADQRFAGQSALAELLMRSMMRPAIQ